MSGYGMQILRADGSVALDTRETVLRLVHIERIDGTFAGTFSVPEFDGIESGSVFTGQGFFYVQYDIKPRPTSGQPVLGATVLPTLVWNNTTKVMTVTPAVIPAGWPFETRPDYDIIFCHFR